MIGKSIFIFELCLIVIWLLYRLYYNIKSDRIMFAKRKKNIIKGELKRELGLEPDMRDPILKRG